MSPMESPGFSRGVEVKITAPPDREARFIAYLRELSEDPYRGRRAMANLRSGLGHDAWEAPAMHEWVGRWFRGTTAPEPGKAYPWRERCYFAVASLYALHPLDWPASATEAGQGEPAGRSLGLSLVELARRRPEMPVAKRLRVLAGTDRDTLFPHLQGVVRLLKRDEVPVDWTQLLRHVLVWDRPAKGWSEDFYRHEGDLAASRPSEEDA
jgi:CRISPR type I-E-associated protein CasB/Cse2